MPSGIPRSPEERDRAIALMREGRRDHDIAAAMRLPIGTLFTWRAAAVQAGLLPAKRPARCAAAREKREKILRLWAEKRSTRAIAQLLGIPFFTVRRHITQARVEGDPRAARRRPLQS